MIQQQQPQVEQVDRSQVVHDTLALVADAVILRTLHSRFQEPLPGVATQNIADSLEFLFKSFEGLAGYSNDQSFVWGNVRDHFVDNFSRLVNKSQTQVGAHTGKTYSDIHAFLRQVGQSSNSLVQKQFTKQAKPAQTQAAHEEVKKVSPVKHHSPEKKQHAEEHHHHEEVEEDKEVQHHEEDEQKEGEHEERPRRGDYNKGFNRDNFGQNEGEEGANTERRGRGRGGRGGYRGRGGRGGY